MRSLATTLLACLLTSVAQANICQDMYSQCQKYDPSKDPTFIQSDNAVQSSDELFDRSYNKLRSAVAKKLRHALFNDRTFYEGLIRFYQLQDLDECQKSINAGQCLDKAIEALTLGIIDLYISPNRSPYVSNPGQKGENHNAVIPSSIYRDLTAQYRKTVLELTEVKEMKPKIQKLFNDVKIRVKGLITQYFTDTKAAELATQKIDNLKLHYVLIWFSCESPFQKNAFYSPINRPKNVTDAGPISVCNGLLSGGVSELKLIYVLAHEIAHAIDQCRIQRILGNSNPTGNLSRPYPVKNLVSCLRNEKSVAAKNFGDKGNFCGPDQIWETTPDWFAAHVVNQIMNEPRIKKLPIETKKNMYLGIYNQFCSSDKKRPKDDVHPAWQKRINNLFMAHPGIRKNIGCGKTPANVLYCTGQ